MCSNSYQSSDDLRSIDKVEQKHQVVLVRLLSSVINSTDFKGPICKKLERKPLKQQTVWKRNLIFII